MNLKDIFLLILTSSLIIIASVVFAGEKEVAIEIQQVEVDLSDTTSNDKDSAVVQDDKKVVSAKIKVNKVKLNINKATKDELVSLTGIGPALSERIITYRNLNGPFKSVDELVNVKGIGAKKVAILKNEAKIN